MITAMRVSVFGVAAVLVLLAAGTAAGDTYVVQPDGFGDYPTIQAAVDAAAHGDIIELADGTFTGDGNRDIVVPAIYLRIRGQSANYMNCIIDCQGSAQEEHRGFHLTGDVAIGDVMLKDIAIINGYTTDGGAGIWVEDAEPEISYCAIAYCTVAGSMQRGGGIYFSDGGAPSLYFCLIVNNTADYGGGVAIYNSGGICFGCDIDDNIATDIGGGMYIQGTGIVRVDCSGVSSNEAARGGGVRMVGSDVRISDCSISRNDATVHSGGVWLQGGTLSKCTMAENSAPTGGGIYCLDGSGSIYHSIVAFSEAGHGVGADAPGNVPYLECCDVYGNAAGEYDSVVGDMTGTFHNFSLDPELCGIDIADYRLFDTSPCLASNSPCGERVGCSDQGCDSPVEKMSWGRLKGMWR